MFSLLSPALCRAHYTFPQILGPWVQEAYSVFSLCGCTFQPSVMTLGPRGPVGGVFHQAPGAPAGSPSSSQASFLPFSKTSLSVSVRLRSLIIHKCCSHLDTAVSTQLAHCLQLSVLRWRLKIEIPWRQPQPRTYKCA